MKAATRIRAPDNNSFVLGEESVPITSPEVRSPVLVVHPAEAVWLEAQGIKGL